MRAKARRVVAIYVDRATQQWIVRDSEGDLWTLPSSDNPWDERQPFSPWLYAIARNKLIDNMRRRGRQVHIAIDDIGELPDGETTPTAGLNGMDAERLVSRLSGRQREIVVAISIEGASARQVAERLGMKEGAVRVALHRALRSLAKAFRAETP